MVEQDINQRIESGVDLRNQVPRLKLTDDERVVDIKEYDLVFPDKHLSVVKAVEGLTDASKVGEIGEFGPSIAANVTEENKDQDDLNKYKVPFYRDAHIVALFLDKRFPLVTTATINDALVYTGVRENLRGPGLKDEQELWKVPHEIRDGENDPIAIKLTEEKDWGWPYYGAVDTTGKNINAITRVCLDESRGGLDFLTETYRGLDGKEHTVDDALQGHVNWIRKRLDFNKEGILEALWINPKHHANQTWADSTYAFHHADGSWPSHHPERNWGVAAVELQAETYDALLGARDVYQAKLGAQSGSLSQDERKYLESEIKDLSMRADRLKKTVFTKFWVEDEEKFGGFFARGTDRDEEGNLRPMAIRSSDMGHLLNSRILDGDEPEIVKKREAVIRNLFSPEMLGVNGIRTLSSDSLRYDQDKYHGGTSWPWVTYYTALGLERHGLYGLSYELKKRAFSLYEATKILPEYGTGSDKENERLVTQKVMIFDATAPEKLHEVGQPGQDIQAWTAAAMLAMKYEQGDRIFRPEIAVPTMAIDEKKRKFEVDVLNKIVN